MPVLRPLRIVLPGAVAAALAAAAAAPVARAGTYTVRACGSDGVNRAFWAYANPGLRAYGSCPGLDHQGETTGLVARLDQGAGGGRLPWGASAWQILEAPPGAGLQSIRFRVSAGRNAGCWSFGLFAWSGDAFHPGDHMWGYGPTSCTDAGNGVGIFVGPLEVDLGGRQKVRAGVRCDSGGGCPTSGTVGTWMSVKDVEVVIRDDTVPSMVARGGRLMEDGWRRGVEWAWAGLADNVGIRHLYGQVDGGAAFHAQDFASAGWPPHITCDYARPRPCGDVADGGIALDTATVADGAHVLRMTAVDAAGNAAALERAIRVDNHAPGEPRGLAVTGGEGWRRANGFDVAWDLPPGQVAPVVRAHWRLCPDPGPPSACRTGQRAARDVRRLEGLQVPGPGTWTLTAWLEDEAGNLDPERAAGPVRLRLDDVAPRVGGFDLPDPSDPRRVTVAASDAHSGLADARIELRARGDGPWRALPTAMGGDGRAVARVPDVELPDGTYELRALVRDAAGNETVADRDVTGRPMVVALPLRMPTRIAGRRPGDRRGMRIPFGRPAVVTGVLETWQGRPVVAATVDVLERPRTEAGWRPAAALRTDPQGRFVHRVAPGPSRALRLAFAGDDRLLPSDLEVRTRVPAGATLRVSDRRARNRARVVFSGRLRGRPLPRGGRTVDLQAHYRGAWRTFATPRTDPRGRWRHPYRFGATRGRLAYRFRVLVKRDASYPYEQGVSPTIRVLVTG